MPKGGSGFASAGDGSEAQVSTDCEWRLSAINVGLNRPGFRRDTTRRSSVFHGTRRIELPGAIGTASGTSEFGCNASA